MPLRAQTNPLKLSFHHVTASVADLETEAAWYERVLGFKRSQKMGGGDMAMYQMTMPGLRIDLVQAKGSARQHGRTGNLEQGWLHVVFQTPDVQHAYESLKAMGTDVKPEGGQVGEVQHLVLHDPEGNEIGIASDR